MAKKKDEYIGVYMTMAPYLKPEYRFGNSGDGLVFAEIRGDKKYGARAELFFDTTLDQMMWKNVTEKEKERMQRNLSKRFKNIERNDKPVDTSNWVRPDRKSIRNECVKSLMALEILDNDCSKRSYEQGRADALYSLLNSESPRNPQTFTNFAMMDYFSVILELMKSPEAKKRMQITFPNYGKGPKKGWFGGVRETDEARKMYQEWKSSCLRGMIVRGSLHHHVEVKESEKQ